MKENIYYVGAAVSSALTFIESLIPVLQVVLLSISLILTIAGLFNNIIDKVKAKEPIKEDLDKGIDEIKQISNNIENKLKEIDRGDKDGRTN